MTLTMTLPDRIGQALTNKAGEFGQQSPDYLKSMLFAACHSKDGVLLKLDLPPPSIENDPAQPQLPLGGGKVSAE